MTKPPEPVVTGELKVTPADRDALNAAWNAYAQHMGDPDGNDDTHAAMEAAAEVIARHHRKRDGILRIEQDGRARFLTIFERIRYFFGAKP